MLASMRFKTYVWPHNPKTFETEYRRKIVQHRIPFSGIVSQNMGTDACVFKGEGEFAGKNAYKRFAELAAVFYEDTPGVLSHPLWPSANVYFTKLELLQEPQEDYVRYSFEFEECLSGEKSPLGGEFVTLATRIVKPGETLGSIAAEISSNLVELLALNPWIKNGNVLTPNTEIVVKSGGTGK